MKTLYEKRIGVEKYPNKIEYYAYPEKDVKKCFKDILNEIEKKKKSHLKNFNKYNKEYIEARDKKDKSQAKYSQNRAIIKMNLFDEVDEILNLIKNKSGFEE